MTIADFLLHSTSELVARDIKTARLDSEIILAHTLRRPRTYLHAHGDKALASDLQAVAEARVQLRSARIPLAYIVGHKEFYGRRFKVSPAVLIPRPETETLVELAKKYLAHLAQETQPRIIDVGTGSGCLGISIALELPSAEVHLSDIAPAALNIARGNAQQLQAPIVDFHQSDLLQNLPAATKFTAIFANLPYVNPNWERSPETDFEPDLALFASDNGLELINRLIKSAPQRLEPNGWLFLEADPEQFAAITTFANQFNFQMIETTDYSLVLQLQK